ncbi:hypothetical protein CMMCAS06_01625 [Clavibacter michiganensis subsp. michiganensis]|uniref:zinc ribbon domain-containing protein n=1 Tax=Clavibacter michiganensis TaxID=28447 RepID=UPI000B635CAA|nr:hypothetical protein [Clavibacter michiganensis]OUD96863.1 hypothetical protein CMMCAS06_01625 [Clavibacter michiganensis subsp. michiganensis]
MKADPSIQKELLDLQEIDTRLTHLTRQLAQLPQLKEIDALQREMELVRRRLGERTGVVEDAQTELSRIESDVAVVQARMDRDRTRIEAGGSSKDVQALERELESLLRRRDTLEEVELEVMQKLEEAQSAQAEVVVERDALAERLAAVEAERDAAAVELRVQAEQARKDRDALAPRFPRTCSRSTRSSAPATAWARRCCTAGSPSAATSRCTRATSTRSASARPTTSS